jgi:uncharacterized protein (TIGR03437 family)
MSLPNGIANSPYSTPQFAASGGAPPYTFSVPATALPATLSLSGGQIAGTPTAAGNYGFTLTATDSAGKTATASLGIVIKAQAADLILSSSSLSFSLLAGSTALPMPESVPVRSSAVQQLLNYAVAVTPSVPWLTVMGGGTTPGSISVALNAQASALAASSTPYQATIAVTCTPPSPCAGNTQNIGVSLAVSAPPPQLTLSTNLLSFSASTSAPTPGPQTLGIQNAGGGTLTVNSVTAADGWVAVAGAPTSLGNGQSASASVSVNPAGLAPGYYLSSITVSSSAGTATLPVGLLVAQNQTLNISPAGMQFTTQAGVAPGNTVGSFLVAVSGTNSASWTASAQSGANWLLLGTGAGSSTSAAPGMASFSIDPVASAALAPGTYYGAISITSPGAANSPQSFEVALTVSPATAMAQPDPEPAGLIFLSQTAALPPQSVQVFAASSAPLPYQASATTTDGSNWLSVSPSTGTASSSAPGQSSVSVTPGSLAPGIYTGGVSYALSGAAVRTVNVTLIVQSTPAHAAGSGCAASKLAPTQTALLNNFATPAGLPVPLQVSLFDNCGNAVANGQVSVSFSNGDPPLALPAVDSVSGNYSATWTPRNPSPQVRVSAVAASGSLPAASVVTIGQVLQSAVPVLNPHATLHVFDPVVGGAIAPGNIVQIYGSNFSSATAAASSIPLPFTLAGTSVTIGGLPAPLYFVSPGQINAQAPFELAPGGSYQVQVNANGALSTPDSVQVSGVSPGIAALPSGAVIAQHLDATLVTEASPAKPGETIVFYLAGLGAVSPSVSTGTASPAGPLATPTAPVTVTVGSTSATVLFAGMTPGLVGLYQCNVQVPSSAADGDLLLSVSQQGVVSNMTILPVHH